MSHVFHIVCFQRHLWSTLNYLFQIQVNSKLPSNRSLQLLYKTILPYKNTVIMPYSMPTQRWHFDTRLWRRLLNFCICKWMVIVMVEHGTTFILSVSHLTGEILKINNQLKKKRFLLIIKNSTWYLNSVGIFYRLNRFSLGI